LKFFYGKIKPRQNEGGIFCSFDAPNGIGTFLEEHINLFVKTSKYLNYQRKELINEVWIVGHFLALSCIESSKSLSWARSKK
jgi:hypothetical protein